MVIISFLVPVNWRPGPWSQWSECDANSFTGIGERTRTTYCIPPLNGGEECPYWWYNPSRDYNKERQNCESKNYFFSNFQQNRISLINYFNSLF